MALLQWIRRILAKKGMAPSMSEGNTAGKNLLTSDEVERALEGFWNEFPHIHYTVRQADIPSKNKYKCCQRFMQTFSMSSTTYGRPDNRRKTVYACLSCGSCQYEEDPRIPAGYLINLREEQQLRTKFPERFAEYKNYLNRFGA